MLYVRVYGTNRAPYVRDPFAFLGRLRISLSRAVSTDVINWSPKESQINFLQML